jgi:hypothetical protein
MSVPPHPDPRWWIRCDKVGVRPASGLDLCYDCGHVRGLHSLEGSCCAHSTSLIGRPQPCDCTNKANGDLFHDPLTFAR